MGRMELLICLIVFFWSSMAQGVSGDITLTDKELIERLTRLEEGQRALGQRFDDLKDSMDKRFDDFTASTNQRFDDMGQRFDDMNKRFDDLKTSTNQRFDDMGQRFDQVLFWLELLFGTMMVMLAGIFTHGVLLWRRQTLQS